MQDSKIFLSSSRYESFGLASAEALACGTPLVAPKATMLHSALTSPAACQFSLIDRLLLGAFQNIPVPDAESGGETFSGRAVAQSLLSFTAKPPLDTIQLF
jgi:hypothetical protein